jgi:hypothetical protein
VEHFPENPFIASRVRIKPNMAHKISRFRTALLSFCLILPSTAFALPGEASAVLAHCGSPASDYQSTSQVTEQVERNLTYGNVILHFERSGGGWSYLSAWDGHTPISKQHVSSLMPCFSDALEEVAANPATVADPTLAADQATPTPGIKFNRAFLILIFVLAAILIVTVALPATRRRRVGRLPIQVRTYRKPRATGFRFRKNKPAPNKQ